MSITMFDSIDVAQIPRDAVAVAGYTAGKWPTYHTLVARYPKAHVLSIAVASRYDADVGDFEPGDIPNHLAPAWVKRQLARKDVPAGWRPTVYTSLANARMLLDVLDRSGIDRRQIRLWTAHYTGHEHICSEGRCGFRLGTTADATQWTSHAAGRTLDQSLCSDGFFAQHPTPSKKQRRRSARKVAVWKAHLHVAAAARKLTGPNPGLDDYIARLRKLLAT